MGQDHTPTPWNVQKLDDGKANVLFGAILICQSIKFENAEFIVKSCNHHADLVTALQDVKKKIEDSDVWWMESFFSDCGIYEVLNKLSEEQ